MITLLNIIFKKSSRPQQNSHVALASHQPFIMLIILDVHYQLQATIPSWKPYKRKLS